ncbi:MAG TPA: hypothetical protein VFB30_07075, partial [Spirochaetia bacterium]|nr:hypothetical protein [Spirochaetia bacterium]
EYAFRANAVRRRHVLHMSKVWLREVMALSGRRKRSVKTVSALGEARSSYTMPCSFSTFS